MRPYRTVLEQKIKERHQTFEEFAESLETFAREHGEKGTLGVRHLHRLAAGRRSDGRPLGPVQPATARLLEHMLGATIDELLAPPGPLPVDPSEAELRQRLYASSQIDNEMATILQHQLSNLRRLDRQLGAPVVHEEVMAKASQVADLLNYSVSGTTRNRLAALLSELRCLAGWQALDLGRATESWHHYADAVTAAKLSDAPPYIALATAGEAFVLADVGRSAESIEILANARMEADQRCSRLLRSWLAAAHGELLAGHGDHANSLRAFDQADILLPDYMSNVNDPYVALDSIHLARWRGHALARCGDVEAVAVLSRANADLDPTFVRAQTALQVDLATALSRLSEQSAAAAHADRAYRLAESIGSVRQRRRLSTIGANKRSARLTRVERRPATNVACDQCGSR